MSQTLGTIEKILMDVAHSKLSAKVTERQHVIESADQNEEAMFDREMPYGGKDELILTYEIWSTYESEDEMWNSLDFPKGKVDEYISKTIDSGNYKEVIYIYDFNGAPSTFFDEDFMPGAGDKEKMFGSILFNTTPDEVLTIHFDRTAEGIRLGVEDGTRDFPYHSPETQERLSQIIQNGRELEKKGSVSESEVRDFLEKYL